MTLAGWLGPQRRRAKQVAVPDVRGLFYHVCLEVAARRNVHVTTVRLTPHPMPVEGLVVDQSPRPPAKLHRHGGADHLRVAPARAVTLTREGRT